MNPRSKRWLGKEDWQHFRERNPGIWHADQHLLRRGKRAFDDNCRRRALLGAAEVILVFGEGQIPGLGAVRRGETLENSGGVSDDFAADNFGDFSSAEGHKQVDLANLGHYKGRAT